MITSTLGKIEEEEDAYPYVGKSKNSDLIVMFTDAGEGVVMYAVDADNYVGKPVENIDEDGFKIYNGPVTVRNGIIVL